MPAHKIVRRARIRDDNSVITQNENSYSLVETPEQAPYLPRQVTEEVRPQAAVTSIAPKSPAPEHTEQTPKTKPAQPAITITDISIVP